MLPAMLDTEIALLESVLRCSTDYLEFGTGGSTALAARLVGRSIISVDSSHEWLNKVSEYCVARDFSIKPALHFVDIGPIRDLGYPSDESCRDRWPDYHRAVSNTPGADMADTFLIDGRFRVACFIQVMLHTRADAIVMVHDFWIRPEYHAIYNFAREIARADNLSVFQRAAAFDRDDAMRGLQNFAFDPR